MLFFLVDFMSNETHLREGTDFGALGSSWRLSLHQLLGDKSSVELSEFFIFIPEDRTILFRTGSCGNKDVFAFFSNFFRKYVIDRVIDIIRELP